MSSPHLKFCATGAERHGAHDVSVVGCERAQWIPQLEKVHVDARHGSLVENHRHFVR